uniref:Serine/threonine-protein kinase 32B n=1 Tax=Steinernema glaseri TaxID=37863 RepID=A0A1I7YVP8_9BILA
MKMIENRTQLTYLEGSLEGDLYLDDRFISDLTTKWRDSSDCLGRTFVVKTSLGGVAREALADELYNTVITQMHFNMHPRMNGMAFTKDFDSFAFENYKCNVSCKSILRDLEDYLDE